MLDQLEVQLQFEQLLADLSANFVNVPTDQIDGCMADALQRLGDFLGVDRVILSDFTDGGTTVVKSWARSGVVAIPVGSDWSFEIPFVLSQVREGKVFRMESVADLPADASTDREQFQRSGARAHLSIPFSVGGKLLGVLTIASLQRECRWPDVLVDRLQLIAHVLANALARSRAEGQLQSAFDDISELNKRLRFENRLLREEARHHTYGDSIVGESAALQHILHQVQQVAQTNANVLLLGETGTGKGLIAKTVHSHSKRSDRPLITVNCAALPSGLIESELFGHEQGAFTGALKKKIGRFELADGGTIFLDEVGDLPLELQGKLLRVLQEGEFERLGSTETTRVDVRVIAATNRELETAVEQGEFRQDLYYRLQVFPIKVPPLRARRDDIPALVWASVHRLQPGLGKRIDNIPTAVMASLVSYDWPGNIRELENVVERAVILCDSTTLGANHVILPKASGAAAESDSDELDALERAHIVDVLGKCDWKVKGTGNAADRLGLHPSTLRARMKKLGIDRRTAAHDRRT